MKTMQSKAWAISLSIFAAPAMAAASLPLPPQTLEEAIAVIATGIPAEKWRRVDDHTVGLDGLGQYSTVDRKKCVVDWTDNTKMPIEPKPKSDFGGLETQFPIRIEYKLNEIDPKTIRESGKADGTEAGAFIFQAPAGDRLQCSFFKSDPPLCVDRIVVQHDFANDDLTRHQAVQDAVHSIFAIHCKP